MQAVESIMGTNLTLHKLLKAGPLSACRDAVADCPSWSMQHTSCRSQLKQHLYKLRTARRFTLDPQSLSTLHIAQRTCNR